MFDIVDAYEHRDRMMMPKYVVNAANDEFFLPTDTGYWWDKMPNYYELNRFILLPNTEHSMITGLLGNYHNLCFQILTKFFQKFYPQ